MRPFPLILRTPPRIVVPDEGALLRQLGGRLQVADLLVIARCDCGNGVDQHLKGLYSILDGDIPRPLKWHPGEVLGLTRWDEPDASVLDAYAFEAAHARRAFACAALLRCLGNEIDHPPGGDGEQMGSNTSLIQLIASLRHLEGRYDAAVAGLLQWLIPRVPNGEDFEIPFLGLGLLWSALELSVGVSEDDLAALADWVMATEDAISTWWGDRIAPAGTRPWLMSVTHFTQRHEVWRGFGDWLVDRAATRGTLVETVKLMAAAMSSAT